VKLKKSHVIALTHRLYKRHTATGDKGLLTVGIGWAMKRRLFDAERGRVITYIVSKKRKRIALRHRIPSKVYVYLTKRKAGKNHRVRHVFKTDVVELRGKAVLTGIQCTPTGNPNDWFTGGALVSWGPTDNLSWGILTVGHALVANPGDQVQISPNAKPAFNGTVKSCTALTDALDAALIQIDAGTALNCFGNLIPAPGSPPTAFESLDQFILDTTQTNPPTGFTLSIGGAQAFVVYAYLPAQLGTPIISDCPNRTNLLLVNGPVSVNGAPGIFNYGTSGSIWINGQDNAMGIQIAAFAPAMTEGIGQSMEDYVNWVNNLQVVGGQQVQLVATF
jgi:hypothetical protein